MGSVDSEPTTLDAPQPRLRRWSLIFGVAVVVLALDQVTKHWAVTELSPAGSEGIHVVGSFWFRLAFNSGMSFSLGTGKGAWIGLVAFAIVGVLIWLSTSIHSRVQLVLIGIVMGGAVGNLADRAFRAGDDGFLGGHVVDFLYLGWWPTFNVADAAVVVGGIVLAVLLTFWPDQPDEPAEEPAGSVESSAASAGSPASTEPT